MDETETAERVEYYGAMVMLTDQQSERATKEMINNIMAECIKYAQKDGIPLSRVLRVVGNGLIQLADKM